MTDAPASRPRVLLLCNRSKPHVQEALSHFRPWLEDHADIVAEAGTREMTEALAAKLPDASIKSDDGTGRARQLRKVTQNKITTP